MEVTYLGLEASVVLQALVALVIHQVQAASVIRLEVGVLEVAANPPTLEEQVLMPALVKV